MTAKVTINGVTISGSKSVVVRNGQVIVDGKDVTPKDTKEINIAIHGDVDTVEADTCRTISVTGKANSVKTLNGDVTIGGDVEGSVQTMSGDVVCGNIAGSVTTMSGNVRRRR